MKCWALPRGIVSAPKLAKNVDDDVSGHGRMLVDADAQTGKAAPLEEAKKSFGIAAGRLGAQSRGLNRQHWQGLILHAGVDFDDVAFVALVDLTVRPVEF